MTEQVDTTTETAGPHRRHQRQRRGRRARSRACSSRRVATTSRSASPCSPAAAPACATSCSSTSAPSTATWSPTSTASSVVVDRMSVPYLNGADDRLRRHDREAGLHDRQPQRRPAPAPAATPSTEPPGPARSQGSEDPRRLTARGPSAVRSLRGGSRTPRVRAAISPGAGAAPRRAGRPPRRPRCEAWAGRAGSPRSGCSATVWIASRRTAPAARASEVIRAVVEGSS